MGREDPDERVSEATRRAEEVEADAAHQPDPPHGDTRRADEGEVDPEVREHFEEMNKIGANEEGEGRIP